MSGIDHEGPMESGRRSMSEYHYGATPKTDYTSTSTPAPKMEIQEYVGKDGTLYPYSAEGLAAMGRAEGWGRPDRDDRSLWRKILGLFWNRPA